MCLLEKRVISQHFIPHYKGYSLIQWPPKKNSNVTKEVMDHAFLVVIEIMNVWLTLESTKLMIQSYFHVCY
jgi:hypothetical protein